MTNLELKSGILRKFDAKKLARLGWTYNIESHIQTKLEPDGPDSPNGSIETKGSRDEYDDIKHAINQEESYQKLSNIIANCSNNITQMEVRQPIASQEPSEPSAK